MTKGVVRGLYSKLKENRMTYEIAYGINEKLHVYETIVDTVDNIELDRRKKMKGDPNELRKKARSKSTRPKWLDRF